MSKRSLLHAESEQARSPRLKLSDTWETHLTKKETEVKKKQYIVFSVEAFNHVAERIQNTYPDRFVHLPINWGKFPDGTDDITIGGFHPNNLVAGENILFLGSFYNNDVTLSQFSVLITLLQSFIETLTIVLPFFPVGTNERVELEGKVATANTYALLFSNLPSVGKPIRLMIYDIHALQERFYFHNATVPSLHTALPLVMRLFESRDLCTVAFPDAGAAKRFGQFFKERGFDIIVCGKVRDGDKRKIYIQEGDTVGKDIVIVDDLVQTGGTLYECAVALKGHGATSVNAYVTHAVFPNSCWQKFLRGQERDVFDTFWVTNSQPTIVKDIPKGNVFEVVDLTLQIIDDLDGKN